MHAGPKEAGRCLVSLTWLLLHGHWELNLDVLEKQLEFLTAEPFHQSRDFPFFLKTGGPHCAAPAGLEFTV